jgi:quinol monooxygenase YgiN
MINIKKIIRLFLIIAISTFSHNLKSQIMNTQNKVSVLIRFKAKNGLKTDLVNHLVNAAKTLTPNEDGTEIWTVSTTPIDEEAVYVYEVYSSADAKKVHETGKAYEDIRNKTGDFTEGMPQIIPLIPMGGKGLK